MRLIKRIINLLLFPAKEWKAIAEENNSRKTVYLRFVIPLLCVMAITTIIGTWLGTSRELYSAGYVICRILTLWVSISVGLYISAFLITEIMAREIETKEHNRNFALLAYSSAAAYLVIIIVSMFPFFKVFLVLSFYACYLYWVGIPQIVQVEGQKRMVYGMSSFIIIALIYLLMFFLFGNIFEAIFI